MPLHWNITGDNWNTILFKCVCRNPIMVHVSSNGITSLIQQLTLNGSHDNNAYIMFLPPPPPPPTFMEQHLKSFSINEYNVQWCYVGCLLLWCITTWSRTIILIPWMDGRSAVKSSFLAVIITWMIFQGMVLARATTFTLQYILYFDVHRMRYD